MHKQVDDLAGDCFAKLRQARNDGTFCDQSSNQQTVQACDATMMIEAMKFEPNF